MKICITGASGFLGRHLLAQLTHDNEVVAVSRSGGAAEKAGLADHANLTEVKADVRDTEKLEKSAFVGCDVVVHAAGFVSHKLEDAAETWSVHVTGTQSVIKAASAAGVGRLIHISSSGTISVSEDLEHVGREDRPVPLTAIQELPYYRAKRFAEEEALAAARSGELDVICLNPSLLLGPGDDPNGGSTLCVRTYLDDSVPFPPPGVVSYVDVRDVADAVKSALTAGISGRRYLLEGAHMGFFELYRRLSRITGHKAPIAPLPPGTQKVLKWLPGLGRDRGIGIGIGATISREDMELSCLNWACDSGRAKAELSWSPRDPIETLDDTVADIQDRRQAVRTAVSAHMRR